jgi:hypothetical protein
MTDRRPVLALLAARGTSARAVPLLGVLGAGPRSSRGSVGVTCSPMRCSSPTLAASRCSTASGCRWPCGSSTTTRSTPRPNGRHPAHQPTGAGGPRCAADARGGHRGRPLGPWPRSCAGADGSEMVSTTWWSWTAGWRPAPGERARGCCCGVRGQRTGHAARHGPGHAHRHLGRDGAPPRPARRTRGGGGRGASRGPRPGGRGGRRPGSCRPALAPGAALRRAPLRPRCAGTAGGRFASAWPRQRRSAGPDRRPAGRARHPGGRTDPPAVVGCAGGISMVIHKDRGRDRQGACPRLVEPLRERVRHEIARAASDDVAALRAEVVELRAELERQRADLAAAVAALHEELAARP